MRAALFYHTRAERISLDEKLVDDELTLLSLFSLLSLMLRGTSQKEKRGGRSARAEKEEKSERARGRHTMDERYNGCERGV